MKILIINLVLTNEDLTITRNIKLDKLKCIYYNEYI